ncbi:ABC transporter permease [Alkalilacustris brevis]|uniref:ABC transporter permease n=1 Tax=Alkalilacustris brevis TaxID=2026338 RepID=UPI000E0DF740|nr:ABC transporter permease [Alkalilacustris brevis]
MTGMNRQNSGLAAAFSMAEVIYHAAVRSIRKSHGNAFIGLILNIVQTVLLVAVFYAVFSFFDIRGAAIRGDFLLYIMTGIFLFMCHIKAVAAVLGAEGPTSPMMKHAPMNIIVTISAAALGSLYIQVLSLVVVLFIYHVGFTPITIYDPVGAMAMMLVAWFSGAGIGVVFMALKPWMPDLVQVSSQIYMRANMVASGKMFVANNLPSTMLVLFTWNPLFHAIDQARGYTFINYTPMHSSAMYPFYFGLACLVLGLMGTFFTRQRASISWQGRR